MSAMRKALVDAGKTTSPKFVVVAEIANIGPSYGFANVLVADTDGPSVGENVYLIKPTCEVLLNHKADIGDQIVVVVKANDDERHAEETPWVGVRWNEGDQRNLIKDKAPKTKAEGFGGGIAQKIKDEVKDIIENATDGGVSTEELRADTMFKKAFEDLKLAMTEGAEPKAKSALGRMRARVTDLLRPAAISKALKDAAAGLDDLLQ